MAPSNQYNAPMGAQNNVAPLGQNNPSDMNMFDANNGKEAVPGSRKPNFGVGGGGLSRDTLYVNNLPKSATTNDLQQLFLKFGGIKQIRWPKEKHSGELKNMG